MVVIEILAFTFLLAPATWEQHDDKAGDPNKQVDVIVRAVLMLLCSILNYMVRDFNFINLKSLTSVVIGVGKAFFMSFGWFFLVFDYWVNYRLGHKEVLNKYGTGWLEYLGKTMKEKDFEKAAIYNIGYNWWDTQGWWIKIRWQGRLITRLVVYGLTLTLYLW